MTLLEIITSILGIITSSITILGVPLLAYAMWFRGQQNDGTKIASTDAAVNLLRTEFSLKLEGVTDALKLIKANDLHSIYEKQRDHGDDISELARAITRLETIIDERIPKKNPDKNP